MRKEVVVLFLFGILLISPLIQAQEQYQTYSGFNRFIDNVKLVFSGGDNKVELALEIREKEVDSAISISKSKDAIKNLERAKEKLQIIQQKVSLETSEKIKTSVDEIKEKINKEEHLPDEFKDYLLEEEKTQLTAVLTEKTFEYCTELANEDFALMLGDEECNPETAMPGLEKDLKKLKKLQEESFIRLMLEIRSCIDDPGTCNCEASLDDDEKAKCEKMVALAVKCEYKDDETSCAELEVMMPSPGDGFARSFIPDYLKGSFNDKRDLIEYGLEHSDGVPEECWNENDKPECDKYDSVKEDGLDWDEEGNWIGWQRGKIRATNGTMESMPTMEQSVPECFDETGNFLEEKCGKITVVWKEDGLVNYIVEKQVDDVIEDFENSSRRYAPRTSADGTMDIDGTVPMEIRKGWMMENNEWVIDPGYREMKKEMDQIQNQIKNITYAPGTGPGEFGGVVVDGDGNVVTDDDGNVVVTKDMTIDAGPLTDDSSGGGDGSICCKKTKDGETRYHWDSEDECLDPANIKGEVVDDDSCLALGDAINDEDPESWGSVEGGVPEECVAQGAYDDESCEEIMRKLPICCRREIGGEVVYELIPKDICVSPYGDREDESLCLS